MRRPTRRLVIAIKTNFILMNREAANAFMNYLAYVFGGLLLGTFAVGAVLTPESKITDQFPLTLFGLLAMFDYFNIQTKLNGASLVDKSFFSLFPLPTRRSIALRFLLLLADKRAIFYLLPMLAVAVILVVRGNPSAGAALILLFGVTYLIASELLFVLFPLLRKLADRFSVRTVVQIVGLPFLAVFMLAPMVHLPLDLLPRIPVLAGFVNGFRDATLSNSVGAVTQVGYLFLISVLLAAFFVSGYWLFSRIGIKLRLSSPNRAALAKATFVSAGGPPPSSQNRTAPTTGVDVAREGSSGRSAGINRRLVFLDWKIHQKEERLFYTIFMFPLIGVFLAQTIARRSHSPLASVVLPVFLVTLMLSAVLTDNYITNHGLRLKQVSIFPIDRKRFVFIRSLSSWSPVVVGNLVLVVVLGVQLHIAAYQFLQGVIYSFFMPLVTILLANTLIITFNIYSRHPIITFIIIIIAETLGTLVYALLMILSLIVGIAFVLGLFSVTYYLLVPAWGRQLSARFQTLLEESK